MTLKFWQRAAAVIFLGFSGTLAVAQTVTPSPAVLTFTPSPVGVSGASIQKSTVTFQFTNGTGFIAATAALHYGTSYSAGTVNCTGTGNPTETCTVQISFVPTLPGGRRDALFLMNGTTRLATVLLYGVGQSPLALIQPGVLTMPIKNSANYLYTSIVDEAGTVYQLESGANAVESVTKAGVVTTLPITGLNSPRGIGIDGAGVLYIADQKPTGPITTYDTVQGIQGSIPFPSGPFYIQTLAVGNTGNLYLTDDVNVYIVPRTGASTTVPISPAITQTSTMAVDSNEDVFLGGYTINEIPFGGTQIQVNANGAGDGLGVDAAGTLYASRYSFNSSGSVGELPASGYTNAIAEIDPSASPLGSSVGPDGTVYVGNYNNLDKVDRTQGLVAFGNGTTGTQNVSIYNGGNQSLIVSNIGLTGSSALTLGTATTNNCTGGITIAPGAFCNVAVVYSTTHAGFFNGTLTFTDNSVNNAASTQTVAITAESQGIYVTASPTVLNFGNQQIGTMSGTMPVTFTNNGDAYSATVSLPQNTGPFVVTLGNCVPSVPLQVGQSCTMLVSFAPTTVTSYVNTSISFGATWAGPTQVVTFLVNGAGINPTAPVGSFAPASLAFGTQNINTTSPSQPLLLTNTGTAQLNINSISITGTNLSNFAQTNTCGGGLAPNGSCTINVTFSPNVTGPFSATVSVATNAAVSPTTAALTGTGVSLQVPQLQFTPSQLTAIAGTGHGTLNGTGDGAAALLATFDAPFGVAQDASGNIYVVDQGANYVRKIDTSGNITAFAGKPGYGPGSFSGDNGQATAATLSNPLGIAIDAAGSVYIADYGNSRIRKVVPSTGIITTYAGVGNGFFSGGPSNTVPLPGPQGIAFDTAGNLYVACVNQQIVAKITPGATPVTSLFAGVLTNSGPGVNSYNGDNQLAYLADLNFPTDVAADQAGNIYIADSSNYRIRKVAASTGIITTVAGTGTQGNTGDGGAATSAQINATSIATNLAGELYINTGTTIRKVDINGFITTIVGGGTGTIPGPATSVTLNGLGIARTDRYGSLIIPDYQGYDGVLEAGPQGSLVFPSQAVGTVSAPQTVTFENTGDTSLTLFQLSYAASANFNVTGGTCISQSTLSPAGTCTLTVTFAPAASATPGALTGSIPVNSNSVGGATSILLQGTATAAVTAPVGAISPNPDAFLPSPVGQGESAPQPMSFTNTGNGPMTITGISITGANASSFSQTNLCPIAPATLAAGSSCGITLVFTPTTGGALTANVSVTSNATNSPTLGVLTGTGTVPQLVLTPNPLAFGNQPVGLASAPLSVTVSNPGGAPLQIASTTIGGANVTEFGESATCPTVVAAGGSCTITFVFTPQATGPRSATLTFVDNASDSPQTLTLTGNGTAPLSFVSNVGTALPAQAVNVVFATAGTLSSTQVLTQGIANLDFTSAAGGTCATGTAYTAGQSCTVNVIFKPISTGSRKGSVVLTGAGGVVLGTTYMPGIGNGPQIVFKPGVQTTLPAPASQYNAPLAIAADALGNVFVSDTLNNAVDELPWNGSTYGTPIHLPITGLTHPAGIALDGSGNLWIADVSNSRIVELPWNGTAYGAQVTLTASVGQPEGVAVDGNGNVYIADTQNQRIVEVPWSGSAYGAQVTLPVTGLAAPHQLVVDAGGDLFITNSGNSTVVELPSTGGVFGTQVTLPITGLFYPESVAVDGGGNVYVANTDADSVIEVPYNGTSFGAQVTVPFKLAAGANPTGIAIDGNGNLYVVDATNSVALKLDVSDPPSLSFASTNVGSVSSDSPKTVPVTNIGNASLIFTTPQTGSNPSYPPAFPVNSSDTSLCGSTLVRGASCDVSVTFKPTLAGSASGAVVLTDNNLNGSNVTQSIPVSGTGTAAAGPQATLTPNPLTFPSTTVGSTAATMTISLGNPGNAALAITSISITGANASSFSQTNNCGTSLPLDSACLITVTFSPTATGPLTASVSVVDNATGSPHTATITGTGTAAAAPGATLTPNPLAFPATTVGTPVTLPLTLSNPGTAVLNVNTYTITGTNASNFTFTNGCSASLGAGLSCTLNVTFTPTSAASFTATFSVSDNATGSPHTATLTGTGTAPLVATVAPLSPNPLTFSNTNVGSTATAVPITVSNTGGATLTGIAFSIGGTNPTDFATTSATTCGTTLAAGASCLIYVSFTPASAATFTATLSVTDSASTSPQTATLTGTGVTAATAFTVTATTPTVSVSAGSTAVYNLVIAPVGGTFSGLVTLSATGLPTGASASFLPPAVTPGSTGAPSVLSIQTPSLLARQTGPSPHSPVPLIAVLAGVPLLSLAARRRLRKASRRWMLLAIAALSILPALAMTGCNGGYFGPTPKTFIITVTGTSGALQQTTTVSLTVQ